MADRRESKLDDRHIVRRMVLKRVVYGVDKNPMAVELAKVALWLHSFTVGAPLSFLNHHLRAGDSVIGAWVRPTVDALQKRGALFNLGQIARVERVAGLMAEIEETTDNDVAEVASSKAKFGAIRYATSRWAALTRFVDDGRLEMTNNAAERAIRPLATGLSLCSSFSSIWKHWKCVCGFGATRATFSGDRHADGLRLQVA